MLRLSTSAVGDRPSAIDQNLAEERRAMILVVVLALLSLFAIVGLTFVFYAQRQASASLNFREARQRQGDILPVEQLARHFMSHLIYDVPDQAPGIYSGMRGHSLARLVYGYNDGGINSTPFDGTGRLHAPSPLTGVDDYWLVNYTYFPADGFLRDPERLGWRPNPDAPRGLYTGGFNVPYTYPDLNNLFLAALKADGTLLMPSFHRPWLFNNGFALNDTSNPNWTNAAGKYLTLRPRPVDMGPGFPYPADATGDVKNFLGGRGGNDSIWIDLGFPVVDGPEGRKLKPLFAALVVDLDGRVNLNVHGNVRGSDALGLPVHASNQGWGPWEVNLQYVLGRQTPSGRPEWPNLFLGANGRPGRYGTDGRPGKAGTQTPYARLYHSYAQVDFDACQVSGTALVPTLNPFALPGTAQPRSSFPSFPAGYDNTGGQPLSERWEHPVLADADTPQGDDQPFSASDLVDVLLLNPAAPRPSRLADLCPTNFADPRTRGLVTTHSSDFESPGVSPWMYDPTLGAYAVDPKSTDGVPAGPPLPFPSLALRTQPVPIGSEFIAPLLAPTAPGVSWRSRSAGLGRVNLNRPLTPYPLPAPQTTQTYAQRFDVPSLSPQFLQAQQDRQLLANDIYDRLLQATGVPRSGAIPNKPTAAELQVRRWLAQLAVNLVDYIDEDDISTPFNFYTPSDATYLDFDVGEVQQTGDPAANNPELPKYWVFGTELPHVVLNEALVEYQDPPPAPPGTAPAPTTVRVWVELNNPFQTPGPGSSLTPLAPQDGFPVRLLSDAEQNATTGKPNPYAPFRVVLATGLADRPLNDNVLGSAATVRTATADADFGLPVNLMNGQPQGTPSPSVAAQGFFLIGPPVTDARNTITAPPRGTVPAQTPLLQTPALQYQHVFDPTQPEEKSTGLTVLLRRLANPHLPFDDRPSSRDSFGEIQANPWYNPYVTIDVMEPVPLRDGTTQVRYASRGKRQPYASHPAQVVDQVSTGGTALTQQTFGLSNNPGPTSGSNDWLVHLDRELISPAEMLHVAACQPYQLTRRFIEGDGTQRSQKFHQGAPWFDQSRRLYRAFEFFTARSPAGRPFSPAGRVPGKINLNTVWDPETFLALCDPQSGNGPNFTADNVVQMYNQMIALRTPGLVTGGGLGPGDRPFLGLATGYSLADSATNPDPQHPGRGAGINDTLFRAAAANADSLPGGGAALARLFQVPNEDHPYRQYELLTKVFNQVTTRSNVFAVWVTVGFFEVTDETTRPVKLGAEFGRSDGRYVRPRFFALLDRTLVAPEPPTYFDPRREPAVLWLSYLE
ncbi:MAG: hypothetical protein HYS12_11190 [Planctomycetes bacterium]|nr:hypothetical protein [Planctomycetota bacterium]